MSHSVQRDLRGGRRIERRELLAVFRPLSPKLTSLAAALASHPLTGVQQAAQSDSHFFPTRDHLTLHLATHPLARDELGAQDRGRGSSAGCAGVVHVEGANEGGDEGEGTVGKDVEGAGFDSMSEKWRSIARSFSHPLASPLLIYTHTRYIVVHSNLHLLDSIKGYPRDVGRNLGDEAKT